MKRAAAFLREYFSYSRKERNGILVLLIVLSGLISVSYFPDLFAREQQVDYGPYIRELEAFENSRVLPAKDPVKVAQGSSLFFFDPNNLPEEKWLKLGLSPKQVRVILNYQKKGGHFTRKEDLAKIYGMKNDYERLEPYIRMEQQAVSASSALVHSSFKERTAGVLELNTADSADLISLPGIGPAYASRILKYRTMLGGFYAAEQLMEVYGMDSSRYALLHDKVRADGALIRKIPLNSGDIAALKHPYLDYKTAHAILNYRKQHGHYQHISDVKKIVIVTPAFYNRIEPYLDLQ